MQQNPADCNHFCLACSSRFSCIRLFATLWTLVCQAPLSMGFSRQEYWSGLPCPPPRIFPTQGSSLPLLRLLHHKWILYHLATREALYCPEGATDIISGRNCSFVRKARSIHYTYEREGPCCLDERVCHCEKDRKAGTGTMALS